MPRRTTPVDEGIRAYMDEYTAAVEQEKVIHASTIAETAAADAAMPMKMDVRITSTRSNLNGSIRAFATLTVNNVLDIRGLRVMEGERGMFVSMPARRLQSGEYSPVCRAATPEFKELLNNTVLGAYQAHVMEQTQARAIAEVEQTAASEPEMELEM